MSLPSAYILNSPEETQIASAMHELILRKDDEAENIKTQMAESLKKMDPQTIFRITSYHPDLQYFCRQQIDTQIAWAKNILQGKYPSVAIQTLDGRYLTIYDLLMGACLYSGFVDEKAGSVFRTTLIDQACDWRCYHALLLRCQNKLKWLDNLAFPLDENKIQQFEKSIQQILTDASILGMTYWQAGFFQAGNIINQLSNSLAKKVIILAENRSDGTEALLAKAEEYMRLSVKYFLCGFQLGDHVISKMILNDITQGKGVAVLMGNDFLVDQHVAQKKFIEWVTLEVYQVVEVDAKKYMMGLLRLLKGNESTLMTVNESDVRYANPVVLKVAPVELIKEINEKLANFLH